MSKYIEMKKEDARPCAVYNGEKYEKYFFHMWFKREGRFKDKPKELIMAIVKSEKGEIEEVYAHQINFMDRETNPLIKLDTKNENEPQEGLFGEE